MRFVDLGAAAIAYIREVAGHADLLGESVRHMNLEAGTAGVWLPEWIPSERYLNFAESVYWTSWESYADTIFDHTNETALMLKHLSYPSNVVLIEAGPFALDKSPSWSENLSYYWLEGGRLGTWDGQKRLDSSSALIVLMALQTNEDKLLEALDYRWRYPSVIALSSLSEAILPRDSGSWISQDVVAELAKRSDKLLVNAYDDEAFIVWKRRI